MANIFRSKDIYKRAPKIPSSEDPLRIVKGLYVVGDYKPPYYIGPCLHITDIKTNKATVVDYTTKNMSYEDLINFCKNKYAVNYNLENICNLALKLLELLQYSIKLRLYMFSLEF